MKSFRYVQVGSAADAVRHANDPGAAIIAGGTDLLNLMKDGVTGPELLVDINGITLGRVQWEPDRVRIGALARMADVARDRGIVDRLPMLSEALLASASGQVRSMATIGGNLLQRTRCWYFRDTASPCNTRTPGSGCPAVAGENRWHAVFGGSDACIKVHPSDLAVALTALGAVVRIVGPRGDRDVPVDGFYRLPGSTPQVETVLEQGELIVGVDVPLRPAATRSRYVKIRDRASFEFALVALAAAVELRGGVVGDARIVFGGVAPVPWRSGDAEAAVRGRRLDSATIRAAGEAAVRGAVPRAHNGFKVELMRRSLTGVLSELGGGR